MKDSDVPTKATALYILRTNETDQLIDQAAGRLIVLFMLLV